jgi:hypothetical protein
LSYLADGTGQHMVNGLSAPQAEFLGRYHSAAMITTDAVGTAKAARVGVAVVRDRVWSSGTQTRVRTRRLRVNPRSTLFVFGGAYGFLTLESTVTLLDGPNAAELNLQLFRIMQQRPEGPLTWSGRELDEDAFCAQMVEEGRLIYQFEVRKAYGAVESAAGS